MVFQEPRQGNFFAALVKNNRQLGRASLSIVLNLAEGCHKESIKDKKRFYGYSLTSLREVQALLEILDRKKQQEIADQLGAMLFKLIQNT